MNKFKKLLYLSKAQKIIDVGTEVMSSVYKISTDPRASNIAFGVSKVIKTAIDTYTDLTTSSTVVHDWSILDGISTGLTPHVRLAASLQSPDVSDDKQGLSIFELYGKPLAFYDQRVYTPSKEDVDEMTNKIGRLLAETWGPRCLISQCENRNSHWSSGYRIEKLSKPDILGSELQDSIIRRIEAFRRKKKNRSILLYGPPGTGKSCLANGIAAHLSGLTMVIDATLFFGDEDGALARLMRPQTLIVHDIDHVLIGSHSDTLTILEELHRIVPVVVMTANSTDINKAFLRPGRFDDLIEIKQLGDAVFQTIIGRTLEMTSPPDKVLETLKLWPAVFLKELANRIDVLGIDAFTDEFADLEERIKINNRKETIPQPFTN